MYSGFVRLGRASKPSQIPYSPGERQMMVVVQSRRLHCMNCKQIGNRTKTCPQKNIQTTDTTKEKPLKEAGIEVSNPASEHEDPPSSENGWTQEIRGHLEKNRWATQSSDSQSSDSPKSSKPEEPASPAPKDTTHTRKANRQMTHNKDSSIETPMETSHNLKRSSGLPGMRCPLVTGLSKRTWQTCQTASAALVVWKKRLRTPSTTASGFACFGYTSGSGRPTDSKQLVLLDVGYVVENVDPPYRGEKRVVFLSILVLARMANWKMRKKGLYDGANFSHHDLILFFRYQKMCYYRTLILNSRLQVKRTSFLFPKR